MFNMYIIFHVNIIPELYECDQSYNKSKYSLLKTEGYLPKDMVKYLNKLKTDGYN